MGSKKPFWLVFAHGLVVEKCKSSVNTLSIFATILNLNKPVISMQPGNSDNLITIDGSYLEGGGQIVRTALAISSLLQKGFRVEHIRKGRPQPGLKAQHLYCIRALQELTDADTSGAELGSDTLVFIPKKFQPKSLNIDIGTAGSVSLLLQSLLLPCMLGSKSITLKITGGTDTEWAMPFDYLQNVFIPQLQKFAKIKCTLLRRGYYPKGGGKIELKIKPLFNLENANLAPKINLIKRGNLLQIKGVSHASLLLEGNHVAERQAKAAEMELKSLKIPAAVNISAEYSDSLCAGSGIVLWALFSSDDEISQTNPIIIGADALGEKGKTAESVGIEAAKNLSRELNLNSAVDSHLADNLIPFTAVYGGKFIANGITNHTLTNIYTVENFMGKLIKREGNFIKRV